MKTVKLFLSNVYIINLYISVLLNFGTSILNGPYDLFINSVLRSAYLPARPSFYLT